MLAEGHRDVGLLDARQHLIVKLLLQRLRMLHLRFRVRILGVEVCDHVRISLLADPEVVVGADLAVEGVDFRLGRSDGRHQGRCLRAKLRTKCPYYR